ncbi:NADH-quinone oxidoreductase subunit NuoN [Candidatus Pelagibacter bacterium]|jgi:NADH-quinone oxidoreductase subunit N|nr:NADH-quinone oxidoreductase subunit NuoN [Alphaproteobacteria bacterium]MBT3693641.1 NADH-quinone oxidoreductase subunit NuoN [Candidatus Pelagibacter sp.]MDB2500520.1 NADH-quinone oxidoreductase subunit NuoN [Candidatus Pelagibacter bacterium]MDB2527020.1 NADH-quinone oxidoreductase subunit NuoN [Candidatus Pelagibacter bacterium]MDC0448011.1 NADH-quinone oxidoreductase subunit NuoN [Candidatus Pelagibacter sp.]|tara:strand:+ start:432 stop:1847 length:1416 start_codon:yes stop_codon:yes gene_type:complete
MNNLDFILPEIFISLAIMFLLILGVFKKNSSNIIHYLSIVCLLITGILIINNPSGTQVTLFSGSFIIDNLSSFMKILTILGGASILLMSKKFLKISKIFLIEYPILILSSILGMLVMISSNDLMVFYIGLELQSLALYVLASFNRDQLKSSESGLKYFVLSALSSGLLLYGCSLIYGFSGSTNFDIISNTVNSNHYGLTFGIVFILVGLSFKISAVPFHMWAPDVYEGSPTPVTLFFSVVPKIAALTVFIRFLYVPFINMMDQWQPIIIFLSIASMIFGAIAAIGQKNLKRLIAYSSIGHIGYALAGLSVGTNEGLQSSIVYISIYIVMNLGFFSCLLMMKKNDLYFETIEDLSGLSKNHPILSLCFLIVLFSLAGIPPLAGFFAKFYIFKSVIEQSMYFLAIVGLLSTVIAAFYYLRIIKVIYFDEQREKYDTDHSNWLKVSLTLSTLLILLYFIFPSKLLEIVSSINVI